MGVTRQAPTATTSSSVRQLKAEGKDEGEDKFDKRFPVAQQLKVGGFVVKIDSDSPVFAGLACGGSHGSPSG
jgi:hypothetical protein